MKFEYSIVYGRLSYLKRERIYLIEYKSSSLVCFIIGFRGFIYLFIFLLFNACIKYSGHYGTVDWPCHIPNCEVISVKHVMILVVEPWTLSSSQLTHAGSLGIYYFSNACPS